MAATATAVYDAKGAFFDKLVFLQSQGIIAPDVTIAYDEPPAEAEMLCIYGGGIRFTQTDLLPDHYGLMISEDSTFSIYLRAVARPRSSVRETDALVVALATKLVKLIVDNSEFLPSPHTWKGIGRGQGDYANTPDECASILALEIKVGSTFSNREG